MGRVNRSCGGKACGAAPCTARAGGDAKWAQPFLGLVSPLSSRAVPGRSKSVLSCLLLPCMDRSAGHSGGSAAVDAAVPSSDARNAAPACEIQRIYIQSSSTCPARLPSSSREAGRPGRSSETKASAIGTVAGHAYATRAKEAAGFQPFRWAAGSYHACWAPLARASQRTKKTGTGRVISHHILKGSSDLSPKLHTMSTHP